MFKGHKKLRVFIIILCVLSGAGVAGYILALNEPRVVEVSPETSDVPAGAEEAAIAEGASIDWDYEYKMCSHHVFMHCNADENFVGLTFSDLQSDNPEIRIVSFAPDHLELKMSFDCYCPDHYILKQYRDELAVFRTMAGTDEQSIFLEVPLRFNDIDPDYQPALEAGKLFDSLEELEFFIEDLET